jgi:hypothetical protein
METQLTIKAKLNKYTLNNSKSLEELRQTLVNYCTIRSIPYSIFPAPAQNYKHRPHDPPSGYYTHPGESSPARHGLPVFDSIGTNLMQHACTPSQQQSKAVQGPYYKQAAGTRRSRPSHGVDHNLVGRANGHRGQGKTESHTQHSTIFLIAPFLSPSSLIIYTFSCLINFRSTYQRQKLFATHLGPAAKGAYLGPSEVIPCTIYPTLYPSPRQTP